MTRDVTNLLSRLSPLAVEPERGPAHHTAPLRACDFIRSVKKPTLKTKSLNAPKTAKINKVTSSQRSPSQIYPVIQCLWRGVEEPVPSAAEGTSAVLILPTLLGVFRAPKPDNRICCDIPT